MWGRERSTEYYLPRGGSSWPDWLDCSVSHLLYQIFILNQREVGPSGFDKIRHEAEITLNYITFRFIYKTNKKYTQMCRGKIWKNFLVLNYLIHPDKKYLFTPWNIIQNQV